MINKNKTYPVTQMNRKYWIKAPVETDNGWLCADVYLGTKGGCRYEEGNPDYLVFSTEKVAQKYCDSHNRNHYRTSTGEGREYVNWVLEESERLLTLYEEKQKQVV